MAELKGTRVRRGGETARYWYGTTHSVEVSAETELRLSFSIPSKGGGRTQLQMEIRPEDFSTLLQNMTSVDRQAAMDAMAAELSRQIAMQSERERVAGVESTKKCAHDIWLKANEKYNAKPIGEDEQERIVKDGVEAIISEIGLD